jgi:phage repressor protein C with HTH and peptisase S24 domain
MSERNEWERDLVVWLAGRRIEARGARRPMHPGFESWRAAGALEAEAARFAERVRARVAAARLGVGLIDHSPEPAHADAPGTVPLIELGVAAGTGRELLEEPCDTRVALPPEALAGRCVALRVVGDSMQPLLHSGDVVLVALDAGLTAGAVVVARHPDHGYVVKRMGRPGAWGTPLGSLNPAYPTLMLPPGSGAVIGRVVLRWCGHARSKPTLAPAP